MLDRTEEERERVISIAERAGTSTRTVYRVLSEDNETISLSLADRLLVAVGAHIRSCSLLHTDGTIEVAEQ